MADDYIPPVWPHYAKNNIDRAVERNPSGVLGKDQFLRILVAQLSNQDPTQPLEDRDFIAQMAQFSSLEQMSNVANELAMLRQAIGISPDLIGKSITWITPSLGGGSPIEQSGVVSAITFRNGEQFAVVDQMEIALSQIVRIWQDQGSDPGTDAGSDPSQGEPAEEAVPQ